jgi:hypothetical protein
MKGCTTIPATRFLTEPVEEQSTAWLPNKSSFPKSRPENRTTVGSDIHIYQRRLATTALLGFAPARFARASAANHREASALVKIMTR